MYIATGVIELGKAQDIIQGQLKEWFLFDDWDYITFWIPEDERLDE